MEGLRTPTELVMIVIILLSYGCPIQAIVHAYGVDERTVAEWQRRAGEYCQQVHQAVVEVTRKMTLGALEQAQQLLQARRGGTELKTSFIERFNGTVRERLACLTRKCQHAAHRLQTIEAVLAYILVSIHLDIEIESLQEIAALHPRGEIHDKSQENTVTGREYSCAS